MKNGATELEQIAESIKDAVTPVQIFGRIEGTPEEQLKAVQVVYRRLAKKTYPDLFPIADQPLATQLFNDLTKFYNKAKLAINGGTYNQAGILIKTKRHEYTVGRLRYRGDLADIYECLYDDIHIGALKLARDPQDRDLMLNELNTIRYLRSVEPEDQSFMPFLPLPIEGFAYEQKGVRRQATVFEDVKGLYSLAEVQAAYPAGIDPRDMAWMWRRLLYVLGYVHDRKVIHGAVLPVHVLVKPEQHGLILVGWGCAVRDAVGRIPAISTKYQIWYPAEVLAKEAPQNGTDLFMAARTMVAAMGGNPTSGEIPETVPRAFRAYFRGCLLGAQAQRPQSAWRLLSEFDSLIEKLWGRRRFHQFSMPTR